MPFSTTYANQLLDLIFARRYAVLAPRNVYLGLSTNNPEEDNGAFYELGELDKNGNQTEKDKYVRKKIACLELNEAYVKNNPVESSSFDPFVGYIPGDGFMKAAANREIENDEQINWTKATDNDWTAVNGFGLFETPTGGEPFYYGKLDLTAQQVADGGLICRKDSVMLFDPEKLKISFPTKDSISGKILYMIATLGAFGDNEEKSTADDRFSFDTYIYETTSPAFSVKSDTTYTVVWDDGEYLCKSFEANYDDENWVIIGNKKYTDTADTVEERNSHEPFTIFYKDGKMRFFADSAGTNNAHSIAVYEVGPTAD